MSVLNHLASSLNRRDEIPNQQLAKQIVEKNDLKSVKKLAENLNNKDKNIQSDCIKVLYEIGERNPSLIASYAKEFIALLENKNNRLVWGAMTALDYIASENPKIIFKALVKIIDVADKGSVITNDHAVNILIKLSALKEYSGKTFPLLLERLETCPTNQLPMYAENSVPIINDENKNNFVIIISSRLKEVEKKSKKKRIEKVIKKLTK